MRQRCGRGIRWRMAGSYGRFPGKDEIREEGEYENEKSHNYNLKYCFSDFSEF